MHLACLNYPPKAMAKLVAAVSPAAAADAAEVAALVSEVAALVVFLKLPR